MNSPQNPNAASSSLVAHSQALAAIVERVGASTVAVLGRRHVAGTGVAWRPGLVVTSAHTFRRTPAAVDVVAAGGRRLPATLVGIDSPTDLAVFRLADEAALAAADLGDAETVRAGHLAIAVGRSGEGDLLASSGLVNCAGGPWQTWLGGQVDRLIRLDGGLYDGLSGAPVADAAGAVMGIATAALSRSYGIVVPASTVSRVVDALAAGKRVARPWLGIGAQPVPLPGSGAAVPPGAAGSGAAQPPGAAGSAAAELHGLLVTALAAGSPAAKAGVLIGDIVTAAAGRAVDGLAALRTALTEHVGATVPLALLRGGMPLELHCQVGEWPAEYRRC